MAWRLSSRLARFRATEEAPLTAHDEPEFPAGVVALGRGGAGEIGALLRADGVYIGLLSLAPPTSRNMAAIEALAAALPLAHCQILTTRWPVEADRAAATWRATTRAGFAGAALANEIGAEYLPALVGAGWSEVRTYLAIQGADPETLLHDLLDVAATLPLPAHPATLPEAKRLAGDWYTPRSLGLVTIGWSVTELTAEPQPDWARTLLETPALAAIPTFLTVHLDPVGSPAPVSLELHRRLAAIDSEIEARRRSGQHGGLSDCEGADDLLAERRELLAILSVGASDQEERPRPARLLIACAVEPRGARALRADVEATLHQLGFLAASFGPGRSDDTLLSCAPLGIAIVGRGLTLTTRGAALLSPIVPAMDASLPGGKTVVGLPLGLRRDGAALLPTRGEDLLAIGAPDDGQTAAIQTWALGQLAAGALVTVVDTGGAWGNVALAAGGERVRVALELGALLANLGADRLRRSGAESARQIAAWADGTVRLLTDLCPDLDEDECGDLTASLLALAEGDLAWGEPVQIGALITRLRESASEPARHLAALLSATGALRSTAATPTDLPLTIFDASTEQNGQRLVPTAGCAVVALQAALDRLTASPADPRRARLLILDDLAAIVEATAGPGLVDELLTETRVRGVAVWCAATSLAACPRRTLAALQALDATIALFPTTPEALRANARALDLPPGLFDGRATLTPGEALLVRGKTATPLQLLSLQLPPYALRR